MAAQALILLQITEAQGAAVLVLLEATEHQQRVALVGMEQPLVFLAAASLTRVVAVAQGKAVALEAQAVRAAAVQDSQSQMGRRVLQIQAVVAVVVGKQRLPDL